MTPSNVQTLILFIFPASYQSVGYIPARTQDADAANDSQLLSVTEAHYWFQYFARKLGPPRQDLPSGSAVAI